jgi:hypothetical protein
VWSLAFFGAGLEALHGKSERPFLGESGKKFIGTGKSSWGPWSIFMGD